MKAIDKQHTSMINLFTYLSNNWHIGMISGMLTWIIAKMPFIFEDSNLKVLGGVGMCLTILVASLTAILKFLDVYDNIRKRFRE